MNKYTIDVFLTDVTGYQSATTLLDLTYLELLEAYALINALKYHEAEILLHLAESNKEVMTIEEFIIFNSAERMIYELNQN